MAESSQWIIDRLEPVLREQDGFFTSAQARRMAVPSSRIARVLGDGRVRRSRNRVYVVTEHAPIPRVDERVYTAWLAIDDKRLPWERHLPIAAVSHATAAMLLGIGTIPDDDDVQLTVTAGSGRTRIPGISLHRAELDIDDWCWEREHHVIVTSPARTIVDLVAAGYEREALTRAASDALQRPGTSVDELRAALERHPRGITRRFEWFRNWIDEQEPRR